jgi:hypothetical protein
VFSITMVVVKTHIDELLAESAAERLARSARPANRPNRIATALKSVWSTLSGTEQPAVPTLSNYPY